MVNKDYYKILGIGKLATENDIKKAYRELALKYHPDKNSANKNGEKFREIKEAHDVLSNLAKRKKYDDDFREYQQESNHDVDIYKNENTNKDSKERFHFLDGLRGIASLMIVIHHAFTSNIVKGLTHMGLPTIGFYFNYFTQSGVELFFVLSGVVLLRPYVRSQRKFKTLDYLFRRVKRIYPPYLVALLFAAAICWYINAYPTWYNAKVYHLAFFWPEILRESLIINDYGQYYNLAWWSLGIEILFYLLVPIILLIFPSREKINSTGTTLLILFTLAISLALQYWLTNYHPDIYSYKKTIPDIYQSVRYPVCFLMGILLAAKDFSVRQAWIFLVSGLILVTGSVFFLPLENAGYGLIYAGVITIAFNRHSIRKVLSRPLMLWLGERSYSLFLVHFSVFYLADSLVAHFSKSGSLAYGVLSRGAGIPLAFFAAMLLFWVVERKQARGLITGKIFWPWHAGRLLGDK